MHGLYRDVQNSILRASVPFVLEYLFDDDENELLSPLLSSHKEIARFADRSHFN